MGRAKFTVGVSEDEVTILDIEGVWHMDDLPAEYFQKTPVFFADGDGDVSFIDDHIEVDFGVGCVFNAKMFDRMVKQMKVAGERLVSIYKAAKVERKVIEI